MTSPKISVVLTSYNHKEYIGKAISSILNQSFKDFELIIVDDASTDGSQDIIKEFKDSRIKLFLKKENSGNYVFSTNYGAQQAKGDYLLFAQCDDFADNSQLEILYRNALSNPLAGVIYSSSNLIDEKDSIIVNDYDLRNKKFKSFCSKDVTINGSHMQSFLLDSCVIPNLSAALVKRELFEGLNGLSPEFKVVADWDFWLRVSEKTDFYYIKTPLNYFRQHKTTIRNTIRLEKQIDEILILFLNYKKRINGNKIENFLINYKLIKTIIGFLKEEKIPLLLMNKYVFYIIRNVF